MRIAAWIQPGIRYARLTARAPQINSLNRSVVVSAPSRRPSGPRLNQEQLVARAMSSLGAELEQKNAAYPVIVYSKSYCPYCADVKSLFARLGVPAKVVELDELADGVAVQAALQGLTGRSTVPQVFIGGEHIGGCDDTNAAYSSGKLARLLQGVGISVSL